MDTSSQGDKGNEKVDSLAKQALENEEGHEYFTSKYEAKAVIIAYTTKEWKINGTQEIQDVIFMKYNESRSSEDN